MTLCTAFAILIVALVALASAKAVLASESQTIISAQDASLPGSQHASTRRLLAEVDDSDSFLHEIQKSVVIGLITNSYVKKW